MALTSPRIADRRLSSQERMPASGHPRNPDDTIPIPENGVMSPNSSVRPIGNFGTPPRRFCYNKRMRGVGPRPLREDRRKRRAGFAGWSLALLFLLAALVSPASADQAVDDLFLRLQTAFAAKDLATYVEAFDPALRERERSRASAFLTTWRMEKAAFHQVDREANPEGGNGLYVQVLYENPYSVLLEIWHVWLRKDEGRWAIAAKELPVNITSLFKVRIPSGRAERAARVEIRHQDIVLTFEDAWVFYDNIPDLETALLVIGPGRVRFAPSDEGERHQLEIRYKTKTVEDVLEYAFLRFSDSFFHSNITITPAGAEGPSKSFAYAGGRASPHLTQAMANRAYSIFSRAYPLTFTIEDSLTRDRLSFVPQTDQVAFEFKGENRGEMSYIYSPFSDEEIHFLTRDPDKLVNLYSPEIEKAVGPRKMFISFGQKYDVERCDLDLDFQPEKLFLSSRARIRISAQVDGVDSLKFVLNAKFNILKILDEDRRELFFTQDKPRNLLYVYLLKPIERRATATVEILYQGSVEPMAQKADVLAAGQMTPSSLFVRSRFDTYLYSQNSAWYPSPPEEGYFLADLRFSLPPGYACIANGVQTDPGIRDAAGGASPAEGGKAVFHFETKFPVKYLSVLFGRLDRLPKPSKPTSVPVEAYASSDIGSSRLWIVEETPAILACFESWFGPFPYEKLSVIQRLFPTAGGHSPASFVVLNEVPKSPDILPPPSLSSPVNLSRWREYFLAHEIAHQWWGQAVAGERYHDLWLSEGLAQFAAVSYLRVKRGEDVYAGIIRKFSRWTERMSRYGAITLGSRLSALDFEAYQALVYDKSAVVLAMLRDLLGEDVFFKGLRTFIAGYRFKAARTAHFAKTMETVAGRDLRRFFDGWFDSYLLPEVRVTSAVQTQEGAPVLKFRITQTRGVFVFPLWVTWEENGRAVRKMLEINAAAQDFEFRTAGRPRRIRINPDKAVPGDFRDGG